MKTFSQVVLSRIVAGNAIVPSLLSLFRLSITTGGVFTSWKTARLTPIYKKDDETDCCNYRPISLLSVPSKILELDHVPKTDYYKGSFSYRGGMLWNSLPNDIKASESKATLKLASRQANC